MGGGISSIALLPIIAAKCGVEETAKDDKPKAKKATEKTTNSDKDESKKTGEDSHKIASPIFKEKYAVILGRFQKALESLKDFDNVSVKEISGIISSIQGEQPEKLERAFKKLINLFAEEIRKEGSFKPTKDKNHLKLLREFIKHKRIYVKAYALSNKKHIGGNVYKAAEYSDNFAKLFIALNNNKLLDLVTVHPNEHKNVKSKHASGTNVKLKDGKLFLEFKIGSMLEDSTDLPLASDEIFEVAIEK
ncbi:hypothetical protein MBOVJF4428_00494 [Mycoplasmopsis agalactiae]|uniref:variable surface lipoprotein n=1 Tax=Mycoplasmopsis agalactiae TaxID=2110 RepID=UPI000C70A693|nr:variable surface lipoprotein [Mycoplasmopsis agalactiae]SBO45460.1 hypothetical protein MBOVJF4428_00494 [Mycoplasmopsis agalactiae]